MIQDQSQGYCQVEGNNPRSFLEMPKKSSKNGGPPYTVFLVGLSSDFNSAMLKEHFVEQLGYNSVLEVKMPSIKPDLPKGVK